MKYGINKFGGLFLGMMCCCLACSSQDSKVTDESDVAFQIDVRQIEQEASAGTLTVRVKSAVSCQVKVENAWIRKDYVARDGQEAYTFSVDANWGRQRTGNIIFEHGAEADTVTVVQKACQPLAPDESDMPADARHIAADIVAGWNLGNTLEAPGGETAWGNPVVTQSQIDLVKQLGFNAVRIPCNWSEYLIDEENLVIDPAWLARVKEVVDYVRTAGMYAVLNIHWDGGWIKTDCTKAEEESINRKQDLLWTQIANYFRDYDGHLLFAGCNEPVAENETQMTILKRYEQTFIDAVRDTGGRNYYRTLVVQGPNTDIEKTEQLFGDMPTDVVPDRLMVEVHYYTPWNFCGLVEDADWGKAFYFWGQGHHVEGSDRNATWGEEDALVDFFGRMKALFADKGIPVVLGEYGAIRRFDLDESILDAHLQSRGYFNECVTREAKKHGMVPFYWDDGGYFQAIDRKNNAVADWYLINGIIKGAREGVYPF